MGCLDWKLFTKRWNTSRHASWNNPPQSRLVIWFTAHAICCRNRSRLILSGTLWSCRFFLSFFFLHLRPRIMMRAICLLAWLYLYFLKQLSKIVKNQSSSRGMTCWLAAPVSSTITRVGETHLCVVNVQYGSLSKWTCTAAVISITQLWLLADASTFFGHRMSCHHLPGFSTHAGLLVLADKGHLFWNGMFTLAVSLSACLL